jgi:hypothetical protein
MDGAGEHLLAGAGFAGDQDGHAGGGHAPRRRQQRLHFLARVQSAEFVWLSLGGPNCRVTAL